MKILDNYIGNTKTLNLTALNQNLMNHRLIYWNLGRKKRLMERKFIIGKNYPHIIYIFTLFLCIYVVFSDEKHVLLYHN